MHFGLLLLVRAIASASRRSRLHRVRDVRTTASSASSTPWPTLSYKGNDAAVVMAPMQAHTGTWSIRAMDDLRRWRRCCGGAGG